MRLHDERLLEFSSSDFDKILEISLELAGEKGFPYLFLDEIQNIRGWEKFARRVADMKYHVSITGSNSKMLSSEIATTLGGRYMMTDVFPYSFSEYLDARKVDKKKIGITAKGRAEVSGLFNQFLTCGAFPEAVNVPNKRDYLRNLYQTIYLGDIVARNKLDNSFALRLILKKLGEAVMEPVSFSGLHGIVKSGGAAIGKQTVINYVNYALDAFLVFRIQNYAAKLIEKETAPKYYFMDQGLIGLYGGQNVESKQLENTAAIELIRRYGKENVFFFKKNIEIDFYVPEENLAVQVCYALLDNEEAYRRETDAFVKLKSYISECECIILSMSEEAELDIDGVHISVVPMWKWLLKKT